VVRRGQVRMSRYMDRRTFVSSRGKDERYL